MTSSPGRYLVAGAVILAFFLLGGLRLLLRQGHVPPILTRLWALSYLLPIPHRLRLGIKRLMSYSFLVGAVAVIRAPDGQGYLVAEHRYPLNQRHERWGLPGGAVEQYEPIRAALRREVQQELGVEVQVGRLLAIDASAPPLLDFVFEATIVSGSPGTSSEVSGSAFLPLDRLPDGMAARHQAILRHIEARPSTADGPLFISPADPDS